MLGDVCWFAKPNCRLLGRLEGPPLGMYPEAPADVMVTEGLREWSPAGWGVVEGFDGAPLTMVTPGGLFEVVEEGFEACWGCCMGLPVLTEDAAAGEVDCP